MPQTLSTLILLIITFGIGWGVSLFGGYILGFVNGYEKCMDESDRIAEESYQQGIDDSCKVTN